MEWAVKMNPHTGPMKLTYVIDLLHVLERNTHSYNCWCVGMLSNSAHIASTYNVGTTLIFDNDILFHHTLSCCIIIIINQTPDCNLL